MYKDTPKKARLALKKCKNALRNGGTEALSHTPSRTTADPAPHSSQRVCVSWGRESFHSVKAGPFPAVRCLFVITAHFSAGSVVFCTHLLVSSFVKEINLLFMLIGCNFCLWLVFC